MENVYESPLVEILEVSVEKGYWGTISDYDDEKFEWN